MTATLDYVQVPGKGADRPGIIGPDALGYTIASFTNNPTTTYLYKVSPQRDYSIVDAWFQVTAVSTTDEPVEIAIYNNDLTAQIATSGLVSGKLNVSGAQAVPLAAVLRAGSRYAVVLKAVASLNWRSASVTSVQVASVFGSSVDNVSIATSTTVASPLASSLASSGFAAASTAPFMILREAL